jgi:glyoxylase-like metal-dependent hydrolase (beta-lactamase superfamily II)
MMRVGRYELATVVDAWFRLDGGVLFGIVPRTLWAGVLAPDAENRIRLAARCLVAMDRDEKRVILVDAGPGDAAAADDLVLERREGDGLEAALARLGLAPEDVTDVLLTGLQRNHAGGVTRSGPAGLALAFPRATHHVQRRAWQEAHEPSERDVERFAPAALALLQHSNQLHLVDGEARLFPDVELVVAEGPSAGHQLPRFRGGDAQVTFCGDLVPTHAHVRCAWTMATDREPLTAIEEKKVLLAEALEENGLLVLAHDPLMAACRLGEEDGRPAFREAVEF